MGVEGLTIVDAGGQAAEVHLGVDAVIASDGEEVVACGIELQVLCPFSQLVECVAQGERREAKV